MVANPRICCRNHQLLQWIVPLHIHTTFQSQGVDDGDIFDGMFLLPVKVSRWMQLELASFATARWQHL